MAERHEIYIITSEGETLGPRTRKTDPEKETQRQERELKQKQKQQERERKREEREKKRAEREREQASDREAARRRKELREQEHSEDRRERKRERARRLAIQDRKAREQLAGKEQRDEERREKRRKAAQKEAILERERREKAARAETRQQRQVQRDVVNDFFGAVGRSRVGYRINRAVDFINLVTGNRYGGNQEVAGGPAQAAIAGLLGRARRASDVAKDRSRRERAGVDRDTIRETVSSTIRESRKSRESVRESTRSRESVKEIVRGMAGKPAPGERDILRQIITGESPSAARKRWEVEGAARRARTHIAREMAAGRAVRGPGFIMMDRPVPAARRGSVAPPGTWARQATAPRAARTAIVGGGGGGPGGPGGPGVPVPAPGGGGGIAGRIAAGVAGLGGWGVVGVAAAMGAAVLAVTGFIAGIRYATKSIRSMADEIESHGAFSSATFVRIENRLKMWALQMERGQRFSQELAFVEQLRGRRERAATRLSDNTTALFLPLALRYEELLTRIVELLELISKFLPTGKDAEKFWDNFFVFLAGAIPGIGGAIKGTNDILELLLREAKKQNSNTTLSQVFANKMVDTFNLAGGTQGITQNTTFDLNIPPAVLQRAQNLMNQSQPGP